MKKLTICCSILLAFGVLFSAATTAQSQTTVKPDLEDRIIQVPIPNPGRLIPGIAFTDKNFEPQKFKPPLLGYKPGIAYEVWITTDGVLHCKTNSTLKSASIKFSLTVTSTNANGDATGTGGGINFEYKLNKPEDSDAYLFDLTKMNYKDQHFITLFITSTNGSKAEVILTNKKFAS
jgi:hypothetical protein